MKSSTISALQTLHTWVGVMAGFALFIAFFAGALTVFHDDIALWQNPPWRSTQQYDADGLIRKLVRVHPEVRDDFGIVLPKARAPYAYWVANGAAVFASADTLDRPSADPTPGSLADFVLDLHEALGLPVVGLYLMGIVSVLYGIALLSGVLIHLPQLMSHLFALRAGHNLKRLWQDAHNVIGVLSLPFHVIFAVSGALLCLYGVTLAALGAVTLDNKFPAAVAQAVATAPGVRASGTAVNTLPAVELIAHAKRIALDSGVTTFDPDYLHFIHYGDRNAVVEVRGLSQHTLGTYGTVALSGRNGSLLANQVGSRRDLNGAVNSAIYGLHFGTFGGRPVQWLYFLLGLGGAFLFYSGNLLWIESRRKRRHVAQPARTRVMARATLGICIGSCAGIAMSFMAVLAASIFGTGPDLPMKLAFFITVIAACAYASLRPIARAAIELLGTTAFLYAATATADLLQRGGVARTVECTNPHRVRSGSLRTRVGRGLRATRARHEPTRTQRHNT